MKIFSNSFSLQSLNYFIDKMVEHPQSTQVRKELILPVSKNPSRAGSLRKEISSVPLAATARAGLE